MPPPPPEQFAARLFAGPALRAQPDRRLVRLVREGYESAFEEIVRRYRRPLDRFAASIVGAHSEDVTQESFSKALQALRRSENDVELRPWLYRIVRNTALNDLRDRPPSTVELPEGLAGANGPGAEAERREEVTRLVAGLRALPDLQRAAMVMRELEGLSHQEIAAALGVSSGAGRQAIFRARTALREGFGLLVPLPLLRSLFDGSDGAREAAGAGAASAIGAGGAGAGAALKLGAATLLVAGSLGAGVALHGGGSGTTETAGAARPAPPRARPSAPSAARGGAAFAARAGAGSGESAPDARGQAASAPVAAAPSGASGQVKGGGTSLGGGGGGNGRSPIGGGTGGGPGPAPSPHGAGALPVSESGHDAGGGTGAETSPDGGPASGEEFISGGSLNAPEDPTAPAGGGAGESSEAAGSGSADWESPDSGDDGGAESVTGSSEEPEL